MHTTDTTTSPPGAAELLDACTAGVARLAERVLVERSDLSPGWTAHVQSETAVYLRHEPSYPGSSRSALLAFPRWDGVEPFGWEFWPDETPSSGRADDPMVSAATLADVCVYMDARRGRS